MDTPERGEKFFKEAREMNKSLLKAGHVEVVECREERKDKYGRTLAWVYAGGRLVNGELLSQGLARPLIIPPCGLEKRTLVERLAWPGEELGKGAMESRGRGGCGPPSGSRGSVGAYRRVCESKRGCQGC